MKKNLPQEVDFMNEIKNCEKLELLMKEKTIHIPYMYKHLSTSKVLVMEFIKGYSITDLNRLKEDGIEISEVAKKLTDVFNKLIFKYGFFHADPHPGNIFVEKLKNDYRVVLLDHGLYK